MCVREIDRQREGVIEREEERWRERELGRERNEMRRIRDKVDRI
jgi:hypothetical protein